MSVVSTLLAWSSLSATASGWRAGSSRASRRAEPKGIGPRLLGETAHATRRHLFRGCVASRGGDGDDEEGVDAAPLAPKAPAVDLQAHTLRSSPSEALASLSAACDRLGVDASTATATSTRTRTGRTCAEAARAFGKEDAVFCLGGGMAQSVALAIHARNRTRPSLYGGGGGEGRTSAFACHPTSHLLLHENDAFHHLLGMEVVVLDPDGGTSEGNPAPYDPGALKENGCLDMGPMRLSHVQSLLSSLDDGSASASARTHPSQKQIEDVDVSTLMLELPHREVGGKLTPWEEVEAMSDLCRKRGLKFHCDGARIFEASAGYGHDSVERTARPFDAVYVSFYKGLGAVSGAMLLGDRDFCSEARVWLRRMGGNLYTVLPYAVSSWDGLRRTCLSEERDGEGSCDESGVAVYDPAAFEERRAKLVRILEMLGADPAVMSLVRFDPAVPETNMVHGYLRLSLDECMTALEAVERDTGIRVLSRLRSCSVSPCDEDHKFGCRFEWTMGASNARVEDELFVTGWVELAKAAVAGGRNVL
ncbi:hypothetical protein ACHAWF_016764 [Thalassiosira exigua]